MPCIKLYDKGLRHQIHIEKMACFFSRRIFPQRHLCDWFLLHSIALLYGAAYIPENLSVWIQDATSYSKHQEKSSEASTYQKNIFRILSTENRRFLRTRFRQAGLLHHYIKNNFWHVASHYNYCDFMLSALKKAFINRSKKLVKWLVCSSSS